ncbi:Peroxin 13, N-terminal region-domain-containing protein [Chytridium lagenaria]|nr:Peroxin 13, N-terminal region-domain-containing protein [Chytridium lagenaria]
MNRMGMGGYGAQGGPGMPGPNGELPLTARIEQSTASAFQMIDQIVQAFGGFSQMLESTFFATHSSFMAMVGVAEQFGHLRTYLGRALSIMAFVNMVKRGVYRMLGKTPPAVPGEALSVESFEEFKKDDGGKSKRPMWLFIALLIGLPWLMSKLIKRLQQMSLEEAGKVLTPAEGPEAPIHASQIKDLEFCRALYDFKGEGPAELTFSKGDIIAVLSKEDPSTKQPSMWWRGRLRSGPIGYFPANYVEVIEKKVGRRLCSNLSRRCSSKTLSKINRKPLVSNRVLGRCRSNLISRRCSSRRWGLRGMVEGLTLMTLACRMRLEGDEKYIYRIVFLLLIPCL